MDAPTIVTLIQIIITTTVISLFGFFLALLSYLLDFCFWQGNIFSFWQPWLAKKIIEKRNPSMAAYIATIKDKNIRQEKYIYKIIEMQSGIYKMLGGCSICLNVWLGLFTFPLFAFPLHMSIFYLPIYILSGSFFLRKVMRSEFQEEKQFENQKSED